jgi:hypothetical protein
MNWIQKTAKVWQEQIQETQIVRDRIRHEAEKKASKLGHLLFPWTCMNSAMCKKCGKTVYLHNIHGATDAPDMDGRAITQKCDVDFDGGYRPLFGVEYENQDYNGKTII